MNEKIYVGKGKEIGNFGDIAFSVCITDSKPHFFEYGGKTYLKLKIGKMRNPDEYGKTHTVTVDDFVPDQSKRNGANSAGGNHAPTQEINADDVPF